jgi:hypothetical protein
MATHPCLASQLAREHHRQMLAAASQRQPRPQQCHQASGTADAAAHAGSALANAERDHLGYATAPHLVRQDASKAGSLPWCADARADIWLLW